MQQEYNLRRICKTYKKAFCFAKHLDTNLVINHSSHLNVKSNGYILVNSSAQLELGIYTTKCICIGSSCLCHCESSYFYLPQRGVTQQVPLLCSTSLCPAVESSVLSSLLGFLFHSCLTSHLLERLIS